MSDVQTPVDPESHLWKSWLDYKNSHDYAAIFAWSEYPNHREMSHWATYMGGYEAAVDRPGAGSGMVIVYIFISLTGFATGLITAALIW